MRDVRDVLDGVINDGDVNRGNPGRKYYVHG